MENINEKLRVLQGKAIRLKFDRRDMIEEFFVDLKKTAIFLQSAYTEKGYTPEMAKDMVLKFILDTHKYKDALMDVNTFDEAKKDISLLIVATQKEIENV